MGVWGGGAPRSDQSVEPVELDSYTPLMGANPPKEGGPNPRMNHFPRKNKRVQDLLPQHKEWRKTSAAECFDFDRDPNANTGTPGTPGPPVDGKADWWEVPDSHQATITNLKTKIFAKRNLNKAVEDDIKTLKTKLRQKHTANQGPPKRRPTTADHAHKPTEARQREANKVPELVILTFSTD